MLHTQLFFLSTKHWFSVRNWNIKKEMSEVVSVPAAAEEGSSGSSRCRTSEVRWCVPQCPLFNSWTRNNLDIINDKADKGRTTRTHKNPKRSLQALHQDIDKVFYFFITKIKTLNNTIIRHKTIKKTAKLNITISMPRQIISTVT